MDAGEKLRAISRESDFVAFRANHDEISKKFHDAFHRDRRLTA
jgi:hypothetical protein